MFYIKSNSKGENNQTNDEYIYLIGEEKAMTGIAMNTMYIFFWNLNSAWKMNLKTKMITKLKLYISTKETKAFIKKVRTSSDDSFVTIIVEQSPTSNCIIIWDVENDVEKQFFDCDNNSEFIQDKIGGFYIAERNYMINS